MEKDALILFTKFALHIKENWDFQYMSFQDFEEWFYDNYGYDFYVENDNYGDYDNRVAFFLKGDTDINNYALEEYIGSGTLILKGYIEQNCLYIRKVNISDKKKDFANNRRRLAHITFIDEYDEYVAEYCDYLKKMISQLALAVKQKRKVEERVRSWYKYVQLLEEKAKEENVYVDYSGYQISADFKCIEFLIPDSKPLTNKKNLYNATVKFKEYSWSDEDSYYNDEEQDSDSDYETVGKFVKYKADNNVLTVELEDALFEFAQQNTLSLPENGILFISNLGELAQAQRLKFGLKQLEDGKAKNPNLENILFADDVIIDNVDNQYSFDENTMLMKELNDYQKKAVEGALKAKDLFLIQGPPGTGKTTVIAEICYQGAVQGLKTLVASQSNLAVDNALSRLKADPNIRILRKGNASRVEEEGIDFTEDRVIDRWLQDTSNLCRIKADEIIQEYHLQRNKWEALKAELERNEKLRSGITTEHGEKENERQCKLQKLSQLRISLTKINALLMYNVPELEKISKVIENFDRVKAEIERLNNYIAPISLRRNENQGELLEIQGSLEKKYSIKNALEEELGGYKSKGQTINGNLFIMHQEKESLEKQVNDFEQAKSAFTKTDAEIEGWKKNLNHLQKEHEKYSRLAMLVNEKDNSHERLTWYQTYFPIDKTNTIIRALNNKCRELLTILNSSQDAIESDASRIVLELQDYLASVNSITNSIFDTEIHEKVQYHASKINDFSNYLTLLGKGFEQWSVISDLYNHLTDVANDVEIDVRFVVAKSEADTYNQKDVDDLRALAQDVMIDKPGKLRRFFGLPKSWKQRFLEVVSQALSMEQFFEKRRTDVLPKVSLTDCVENVEEIYQCITMFYQELVPNLIEEEKRKEAGFERELADMGYAGQESIIISTSLKLDKDIELTKNSIQDSVAKLSNLSIFIKNSQNRIESLGFNVYDRIKYLSDKISADSTELDKLQSEASKVENSLNGMNGEIDALQKQENLLKNEKDNLEQAVGPYQNALNEANIEYSDYQQKINDLPYEPYERVKVLEDEINKNREEQKELQKACDDTNLLCRKLDNDIIELEEKLSQLNKGIPVLKRKITMEAPERKMGLKLRQLEFIESWIQRLQNPKQEEKKGLKKLYIDQANVIGITCVQSGSKAFTQDYPDFDVVIIDEVSKATPPELLLPMLKAKKLILVGDHKQLPPLIGDDTLDEVIDDLDYDEEKKEQTKTYFKTSIFEKLFEDESIPTENKASLVVQYRMHSYIMDTINQFYRDNENGGLKCGIENENEVRNHGFDCRYIKPSDHILWYNFPIVQEYREKNGEAGRSYYNEAEISQVMNILLDMNEDIQKRKSDNQLGKDYKKSVGVISFYAEQVKKLKLRIRSSAALLQNLSIRIGTVDRFQGMERDVIIASLVRNNSVHRIGFAKEFRRVNVALSRARELLVIVGCADLFCNLNNNRNKEAAEMYANVLEQVKLHDGFRNSMGQSI